MSATNANADAIADTTVNTTADATASAANKTLKNIKTIKNVSGEPETLQAYWQR